MSDEKSAKKIKKLRRVPNFTISTCMMIIPEGVEAEEDPVVQCWIVERPRLPSLIFWDIDSLATYVTTQSIKPVSSAPVGVCPHCASKNIIKYGTRRRKTRRIQRYFCNDCARTYNLEIQPAAEPIDPVEVMPVGDSPINLHVHNCLREEVCHA